MGENYDQYPNQFVVALTGLFGCALDDHKHPEDGATYRENQEEEEADHIADCTLRRVRLTCTYSGAEYPSKKTLISSQNLENKEPEFFLPSRSMVLKVVTGKIFKTLQLQFSDTACSSFLERQVKLDKDFRLHHSWSGSAVGNGPEAARMSGCQRAPIIFQII